MRAGRLRQRITLQKNETSRLPSGAVSTAWKDVVTVHAEISGVSGRDLLASGAVLSESTVKIVLRYRPDITTAYRVTHKEGTKPVVTYAITAVIPNPKRTQLELLCKTGVTS